ncbi:hypothetical protein OL548_23280 [Lysinibacillus sp. MHQ-1]|nr:hypothetical protein OL548_23280 [Lysinibacillus sp. MHQ-1]
MVFLGKAFIKKSRPDKLPDFVGTAMMDEIDYMVCNNLETLLWLGNQLALEWHIPFQTRQTMNPTEIVFDLDPPFNGPFFLWRLQGH